MEQRSYNTMGMGRSVDLLTKSEDDNFWDKRTRVEQILLVICTILGILCLCLIITVIVLANKHEAPVQPTTTEVPNTTTPVPYEDCTSEVCKSIADKLKASIDISVNPCEDFYSYVCTGWKNDTPIPEDMGGYSTFSKLTDKITDDLKRVLPNTTFEDGDIRTKTKIFYQSCIDNATRETKGIVGLKDIVKNLGGWPLLGDEFQDYSWIDALVYSATNLSSIPIMPMGIDVDAKNTTRYIITLDQETLEIGRNTLLSNDSDERVAAIMRAYKDYIKTSVKILGSGKDDSDLDTDIEEMIEFEKKLAQYTRPAAERRDPESMYYKTTMGDLQKNITQINLTSFLSKILEGITDVTEDTEIIVREINYLQELGRLIGDQTTKIETIANYIGWKIILNYGSLTTQEFRDAKLEFNKVMAGVKEASPLDDVCIEKTNAYFDFALGSIYINTNFDIETKDEVEDMISQLKIAFSELLKTNNWMNDESRKEAQNKLDAMIPMVAFPLWINDTKELNEYYAGLGDIKEDEFFENMLAIAKFGIQKQLKKINEPYNRTKEWTSAPAVVNAYYSPNANTITFPAGILKYPFYQVGLPPAINFAGIGSVIGHEITHGFDDEGSQYDLEGNLKNWWPKEVREKFEKEAQCFVDEYGNYTEPLTGMKLNGRNTLGENIADNGGIRESFKAYRAVVEKSQRNLKLPGLDLTPDQLFFVSYSYVWCSNDRKEALENSIQYNPHSPAQFRVQGPCSNFEEFSKAFNCPADSPMNPESRCFLW